MPSWDLIGSGVDAVRSLSESLGLQFDTTHVYTFALYQHAFDINNMRIDAGKHIYCVLYVATQQHSNY